MVSIEKSACITGCMKGFSTILFGRRERERERERDKMTKNIGWTSRGAFFGPCATNRFQ